MSTNAMELALWKIACDSAEAERYKGDPDAYLAQFRLDDEERQLIRAADVREMSDRKVNDMLLTMFFRALHGRQGRAEYLRRMNAR
jgi:hypothetical protein